MTEDVRYIAVQQAASGTGSYKAVRWIAGGIAAVLVLIGGLVSWQWLDTHLFSIGIEDAGSTTIDKAVLVERVKAFELVTTKDTYDASSNTDFHKRLNLGVRKIGLPGFVAGQELDVKAEVTVSAGVDLAQLTSEDIEVIQQGDAPVVILRIPQAQVTSTEIDPGSFDISTDQGLVTRITSSMGIGERDVRDGAIAAVTSVAQEEAIESGLLQQASLEAKTRLQEFLQGLPQPGGAQITYLVEFQAPLPH